MPYTGELDYSDHGDASPDHPPLILIHGAGGTRLSWPPQLRRLPGRRVLAVDLPGHGKTPGSGSDSIGEYARSIHGFLDAGRIDRAVLCGHSMGSAVVLCLALEYPERISALILIGAGARLRVNPEILALAAGESTHGEALRLVTAYSFSSQTSPRRVELAEKRLAETPRPVLYGDFLACNAFDVMDRLGQVRQPALVLCGEDDRMTPLRYARFLAERMPDARLEVVPEAGHMAMLEQPERVVAMIAEFIGRVGDLIPGCS
jgi:pimeloyl-ACP methyl ester carboxylesterase